MKWFAFKNRVRSADRIGRRHRSKWLLLPAAVLLFLFATTLVPKPAAAGSGPNPLYNIGKYCQKIEELTSEHDGGRCHNDSDDPDGAGWEEILDDALGCSGNMFYQGDVRTDPKDKSVHDTYWFVHAGAYKDCYNKAMAAYNAIVDPNGICASMKRGSDNWDKCVDLQDKLHDAIGCDDHMFKPIDDDEHWGVRENVLGFCKDRLDAIGAIKIKYVDSGGFGIALTDPISSDSVDADVNGGGGAAAAGGETDDLSLGCEGSANPLSWIICPVINDLLVPAINATDNLITNQMTISSDQIFCTGNAKPDDSCNAYYSAWAAFRNLSLGLLAVAGLIIIIAQAIGSEILDAYTIRKALPRLLVAAVGITLSWSLMNFAVTLSNNLGYGIRDLIIAPFHNLSGTINLNFANGGGITGGIINLIGGTGLTVAAGAAAISIWTAAGGLGVLLSYLVTAGLAILIAVLVLVLRQILIIMLILVSPIALLAYVLPNTQRVFRLWWESFSKALLMFPMIAAFIAAGRVFAAISLENASNGAGGVFRGIIAFVAYFAPYFMIPLTFRMSGSAMSGIGSFIQQRSQGAFGALSNYRSGQRQSRIAKARAKGLYREEFGKFTRPFARNADGSRKTTSLGKMLNVPGFYTINADEMLPMKLGTTTLGGLKSKPGFGPFRRLGQAYHSEIKRANRDQTVQAAQDLDIGYKSGRLMAGRFEYYTGGLSHSAHQELAENFGQFDGDGNLVGYRAPDTWKERQRVGEIFASNANNGEAREAGVEMMATANEFEKYRRSHETHRVDGRLLGLLSAAKAGRLEQHDVADNYNALAASGDIESAARETTLLQDALTHKRVSAARGHGIVWDAPDENGFIQARSTYADPTSSKAANSLMRIQSQEIAGSKSEDLDALRDTILWHGSEYEMEQGPNGVQLKGGQKVRKVANTEEQKQAMQRAEQIRSRLKTLAQYNYGDSDVGVKVKEMWSAMGRDPNELVWGGGSGGDERIREDLGRQAQEEQQQQQQQQPPQ